MHKSIIFLVFASLLVSCISEKEEMQISSRVFTARVTTDDTKTGLTGSLIRFESGDAMTVQCEGFNQFKISNAESGNPNVFQGAYRVTEQGGQSCDWYAVYPHSLKVNKTGIITGVIPFEQAAPFDAKANIMYSDMVVADYDESAMPEISFSMNQMMGLIRITFINDNEEYASDILQSVQLRSSVPLSGDFSMDIHSGDLSFGESAKKHVTSLYSSEETLGVDTPHWVTLFVNPVKITGATLIIRTDKHTFTYTSTKIFTPTVGSMTLLQLMDLEDFVVEGPTSLKKRVACWGSSTTQGQYTYTTHLQKLLGDDWIVYNGGVSGQRSYEIAARQGSVPLVTGSAFTIPADTKTIRVGGLLRTHNVLGVPGHYPIRSFSGLLSNPCKLVGTNGEEVLCNIRGGSNGDETEFYTDISRLTPGEPVEIAANTSIETYAARELRDVDLTLLLVGANGSYGKEGAEGKDYGPGLDNLIEQHWEMINYTAHPDSYIVMGFQNREGLEAWGYSEKMQAEFNDKFLNLRTEVVKDEETCKYWLIHSGACADESLIDPSDLARAANGHWPIALEISKNDSHPNDYGCYVIAALIYDRMKELGYLD